MKHCGFSGEGGFGRDSVPGLLLSSLGESPAKTQFYWRKK